MEDINLDHVRETSNDINLAVKITDAYKAYNSAAVVLNGFNMNVEKGTIYGLLGPSGCGKTTLLSCIIGRGRLDSGHIQLSVKKKKEIGYMPQDLALYDEFNILETFHYFGSLYEMSYEDIIDKGEKLINLMEMPPAKTQFGSMSGGQQRRFSLCTALLHDPSLLILDEPTVGLDPIISASIWEYLQDLTNRGKTIIITTHYIEEARLANTIGLMRKGILLSEAPPLEIMASCNADTLESAFLILSQKQTSDTETIEPPRKKSTLQPATTSLEKSSLFSPKRFKAQLLKHWYWSVRNWTIILFVCLLPLLTITIYNLTIGQSPQPLNVGIVNYENPSHCSYKTYDLCDSKIPLSCKYMKEMEKHDLTLTMYKDDEKLARQDARHGHTWGFVTFAKNFTDMIGVKFSDPSIMSSHDIEESAIKASLDMSNYVLRTIIQGKLHQSYKSLTQSFTICNKTAVTTALDPVPITLMEPVFGTLYDINMSHYGAAAIISILELYLTFLFTALSISMEKNSGLIERSLSSGLTILEVILSQLVVQIIMLIVQTITVFILQFIVFDHPFLSSWIMPFVLVFLQGICGTFMGFAASITFDEEKITTFFGICLVMSQVFLSGIMWPLEAMDPILKKISLFFPLTLSVDAFRSITARNWGLSHPIVMQGFISITLWIFVTILISILSLKFKQGIKAKK
ncbi:ABC transporter G family member 23 [Acyrthosiphon pisum]|uniref:ABC transporter G family member 23 n=1 Tax=Acyrthosiphon pisum TaxID=7029 RepID=A0A8R1W2I4_ACYPI|nr:ABC transporter G family member 23 [Acyrthosiphon pisum]XP_003246529.1 ABC transporter G family member 23 [Acyrthosiphon pisum]XP_029344494.1 ABC transporter G family member 23 [Acyrthosiphon pisum]|eukprot:XP_001950287.1 PREDICTED: ABC transporter G family member 23 [Acyrthosiphon pisum]